jgi:SnoaL-like domain
MSAHTRAEVEEAFRHYFLTGPVGENWIAWSQLFTADAPYFDHFYGTFTGPEEIQKFLESTMSFAPHVYSPLVWYNIDGDQIVYKVVNRADNPEPGGPPIEFPSLQVIRYAGDGKWASEEDWWILREMKQFNEAYEAASRAHDPDHRHKMSRLDWGPWVDWARPPAGAEAAPSWLGRDDVPRVTSLRDMTFGERTA